MPTVMVVDDEKLIRTMLGRILEQEGFTVITAGSAPEAISAFQSHRGAIDLLISDVSIPGMDGPTLVAELLSREPGMAVLFISGFCEEEQIEKCGGFPFLCKPFSITALINKVRSLVPASHSVA